MSLLWLGDRVRDTMPLSDIARPILESLTAESGFTSRLLIADHGQPLYVSRVEGDATVRFNAQIGLHEPAHSTAAGKAILAAMTDQEALDVVRPLGLSPRTQKTITSEEQLLLELDRIRAAGFAVDDEEGAIGHACIAASVKDPSGICIAAISISGLKVWVDARLLELADLVKNHTRQLEALIAGQRS